MKNHFLKKAILAASLLLATSPALAAEHPISVQSLEQISLAGTLTLPEGKAPASGWPAALLVQGSGPTDRDGNSRLLPGMQINLLKDLSAALATRGIASLRYDKRGMDANQGQAPSDVEGMAGFYGWEQFTGDLAAAHRTLAQVPGIDPTRVAVIGHSEGGLLLLSAIQTGKLQPAAAILLGSPARPWGDSTADQLRQAMHRQNVPAPAQQKILDVDAAIRAEILATGKVPVAKVPPGLQALYPAYIGPFYKGALALDPAAVAASVRMPVLAVIGRDDIQASAEKDAPLYAKALAGRGDGSRVDVPDGLNHVLKRGGTDYGGPADPAVLAMITGWLSDRLGAGSR